jgi:hypothetical protein
MSALINPRTDEFGLAETVKVSFYPSTDDYAHIAEQINKSAKFPKTSQYALFAFLSLNLMGLPLTLWYFDLVFAGMAVFLASLIFAFLFLPALLKADYRNYYRSMFTSMENEVAEVELTDEGIWCRHSGDHSFHNWKNIKRIEESKQAIFFFFENNGLAVNKTGFGYDAEKDRFLTFAKSHVSHFTTI